VSKEQVGGEKNGAYKMQEAKGANCQIREGRMKHEREKESESEGDAQREGVMDGKKKEK
jgi:hypothetical protein